VITGSSD